MKRTLFHIYFFLQEIGRQCDLLYTGIGAPYEKAHWYKTRTGFKSANLYAKLRCDIKFGML